MATLLPGQPLLGWRKRFQPRQLLYSRRATYCIRNPRRANALASERRLSEALRMTEFVQYMERTRLFYRAQGFEQDYEWAHFDESPFYKLAKPLKQSRVTIVTTAVTNTSIPKAIRTAESILFKNTPRNPNWSSVGSTRVFVIATHSVLEAMRNNDIEKIPGEILTYIIVS